MKSLDAAAPSISFVTCIEAGPLEEQVLRMVESLRKWGGKFANAPVYAVKPRFDLLRIRPKTFWALRDMGVEYVRVRSDNPFPWSRFLNKPLAVAAVEPLASTELVCFLDGDTLIVKEPEQLDLGDEFDFAACVRDIGGIGTTGEGNPNEDHWNLLCLALNMRINDLPFVTELRFKERIRAYFNGGVFSYRRSTGLGQLMLDDCLHLHQARVAHSQHNIYFLEQASLALSVVRHGPRIRFLDYSHNHALGKMHFNDHLTSELGDARVIHYHEGMTSSCWKQFLSLVEVSHPEVAEWLRKKGAIHNLNPLHRTIHTGLRAWRYLQQSAHVKTCRTD